MVCRSKGRGWQVTCALLILLMGIVLCRPIEAAVYAVYPEDVSSGLIGSTVDVPINIDSIAGLEAWLIHVDFDPNVVTFDGIVNSSLTDYYQVQDELHDIDATVRRVTVGAYLADPSSSPQGSGALFKIKFLVNGPGPGATDIKVSAASDSGAGPDAPDLVAGPKGVLYAQTVPYMVTVKAQPDRVTKGNDISVRIDIDTIKDLQAWVMDVQYPRSVLKYEGYSTTALTDVYDYLEINEYTPGILRIAGISQDAPSGGSGRFLVLDFRARNTGSARISLTFPVDKGNQLGAIAAIVDDIYDYAYVKQSVSPGPIIPWPTAQYYLMTSRSSFPQIPVSYPTFPTLAPQLFSVYPYSRLYTPWGRSLYYPQYPSYGFGGYYPYYFFYR
ncbi:MAG: cohesin domain-containing protein [bacterium]